MQAVRSSKSVFFHAGYLCSSCGFTTQVYGGLPPPNDCPNCAALASLKRLWNHKVTETVIVEDQQAPLTPA